MHPDDIKTIIEQGLPCTHVSVNGDGRHFEAVIVSEAFRGTRTLAQHRLVYGTLGDRFDTELLHALSIKTYTPEQWTQVGAAPQPS